MMVEKVKNEELITLVKNHCRELLKEPKNQNLDVNSFTIGFMYGITENQRPG